MSQNTGLIPAGAGQTCRTVRRWPRIGAHPRGCGADYSGVADCICAPGSSPRVRGRLGEDVLRVPVDGLIPAGAGQTQKGETL